MPSLAACPPHWSQTPGNATGPPGFDTPQVDKRIDKNLQKRQKNQGQLHLLHLLHLGLGLRAIPNQTLAVGLGHVPSHVVAHGTSCDK